MSFPPFVIALKNIQTLLRKLGWSSRFYSKMYESGLHYRLRIWDKDKEVGQKDLYVWHKNIFADDCVLDRSKVNVIEGLIEGDDLNNAGYMQGFINNFTSENLKEVLDCEVLKKTLKKSIKRKVVNI